jgi:hypothetical protein
VNVDLFRPEPCGFQQSGTLSPFASDSSDALATVVSAAVWAPVTSRPETIRARRMAEAASGFLDDRVESMGVTSCAGIPPEPSQLQSEQCDRRQRAGRDP